MKTQISVLVKGESLMGKANGHRFLGPLALATKSTMIFVLDGEEHELKESKTPYVFDVAPGKHDINFIDPLKGRKDASRAFDKAVASAMAGIVGVLGGEPVLGFEMADDIGSMFGGVTEDGGAEIHLNEGDIIKLSCKGNGKGVPTVKVLTK